MLRFFSKILNFHSQILLIRNLLNPQKFFQTFLTSPSKWNNPVGFWFVWALHQSRLLSSILLKRVKNSFSWFHNFLAKSINISLKTNISNFIFLRFTSGCIFDVEIFSPFFFICWSWWNSFLSLKIARLGGLEKTDFDLVSSGILGIFPLSKGPLCWRVWVCFCWQIYEKSMAKNRRIFIQDFCESKSKNK